MKRPLPLRSIPQAFSSARSCAAETLAEVMIALVVLAVGATGAVTLVYTSISANAEGEQRIEAYNLAREGVEAVRNIRDTNWLRFPGDRENCWDVMLETTDLTTCAGVGTVKIGSDVGISYVIYPQLNETDEGGGAATDLFSWKLSEDLSGTTIYEYPFGTDSTLYVNNPGDVLGTLDATPYSRSITVRRMDTDGDLLDDVMQISSTVTWTFKNRTKTITFTSELTNF